MMQKITPCLWFEGNAQEAVDFYISTFKDAKIVTTTYYPTEGLADFQADLAGEVLTISFELFGQRFTALNAGPEFKFNEAVSFEVACKDQDEIDYYWERLTADGGEESVCGWLKDRYGLSWQVVPQNWESTMVDSDGKTNAAAFAAMMTMKKLDIAELEKAYRGE